MQCKYMAAAGLVLAAAGPLSAQDSGFEWEGELELGIEATTKSDDPTAEIRDTYGAIEIGGRARIGNGVSVFATFVGESVTDPTRDRSFDDLGLYISELGVSIEIGRSLLSVGKISPIFGRAWDESAGFFGGSLAEDYELTEMIGGIIEIPLGDGAGTLSVAAFFADDTALSRSAGFDRGRNTTAAGGAGNTGQLDNVAVTWTGAFDQTTVQLGARHLSAGTGDASDETGLVASIGHEFASGLVLFAEAAAFDGFGGTADNAHYLTLNAAYGIGNWTVSGTLAHRDADSGGKTDLASVAAEYTFDNDITLGAGLAFVDEAGIDNTLVGLNVVIPFGG